MAEPVRAGQEWRTPFGSITCKVLRLQKDDTEAVLEVVDVDPASLQRTEVGDVSIGSCEVLQEVWVPA